MGDEVSKKTSQPAKSVLPDAVAVEIQRRFNELEGKKLDNRAASINHWLSLMGVVFTFFGIVIPVSMYIGYQRFETLETNAQALVKDIEKNKEKSDVILQALDDALDKAKPAELLSTQDQNGGKIDDNIASKIKEADSFQKNDMIDKAIEKWRDIANSVKQKDKTLAARAWFSVGYLTREKVRGDPDKIVLQDSIAAYSKAIRLNPKYADAYYNRGLAKVELGQYQDAITDYEKAIRLKPNDLSAYYNLSKTKQLLDREEEAKRDLEGVDYEW
ncbi:MAG: tetratricopeptide repeat protein [Nitrospira sp.]|nr:tetratricopeptide repeat protein [Nitrospira sp.]